MIVPLGPDLVEYLARGVRVEGDPMPRKSVRLLAPVPNPGKIIAVGLNYRDHAAETGTPLPSEPPLFAKFANSVIGDGDVIRVPRAAAAQADWEAELGVVIGRPSRRVTKASALDYVAGYMCVNDVSARDLQAATSQWMRGKAIDNFMPCGPWLATTDDIHDPQSLRIQCFVNGEVKQDSSTSQMSWGVAELVSFLSQTMTLMPGDIIATGTPPGVGLAQTPPQFLRDGDQVQVAIEGLGRLTNQVAFE